ncbi:MAG TPA: ATP-binding protein [Kofleriaceae bacterium]|nr:ATP-binding protein [Kofleriaceae bacterium]
MKRKTARAPKRTRPAKVGAAAPDRGRLVHELEVHQVELESQNEELRGARGELEAALARYTELYDFAPIGYATIDAHDVICDVNLVGARLLGAARAKVVGTKLGAVFAPDGAQAFHAMLAHARTRDEPATCELSLRRTRRDTRAVLRLTATAQPREPGALLLAFEDITRHKAERDLLASTERALREANRRKDEFLAMLSHELRNPLAPIRASLFVLEHAEPGSAACAEAHAVLDRQVAHLTRLVDDLLDVTRISSGKIRLRRECLDVAELVRCTVEDHRGGFVAGEIAIAVAAPSGPLWVMADPARIAQAVSNLLGNALKFTPPGGRVEVTIEHERGSAAIRVHDTGVGVAPELLPHVFEPFTQAPQSIDRAPGGLGLGLAMVKGFVELHGGTVDIASDRGGTEIAIRLPLAPRGTAQAMPEERVPVPVRLDRRRVLVIEDQHDSAGVLQTALTMLGLDVRIADNGRAGIEVARAFHPEVVLCDIGLPGMDGHEVARTFRRDHELRDTYLVALSGYAQPEDVERATRAGFSRHIAKPATIDTLARVIAEAPERGRVL